MFLWIYERRLALRVTDASIDFGAAARDAALARVGRRFRRDFARRATRCGSSESFPFAIAECQTRGVYVRLLGSVTAEIGGRALPLGGPKQRAVFALLALSANRTVSLDRLVHEIWRDEPPAQATLTLQAYISRLRRVLGADPDHVAEIVTRPPGWVLKIPPQHIDAERFISNLADARTLTAAGKSIEVADILQSALGLWSDEPLADLTDVGLAVEEIARLQEVRLEATELLYESQLASGANAEVTESARSFVRHHPYRERAWCALILALYRSGQQSAALAALRELREAFAEGLGLDPSPQAQQLEQLILRQDPSLIGPRRLPGPQISSDPPSAPHDEPSGPFDLVVGRNRELDALVAAVDHARLGAGQLLLIEGAAGMGKSTLLHRVKNSVRAIGGTVLCGSGVGAGTAPALWPWITIVRQLRSVEPDLTRELLEAPAADVLTLLDPSTRPGAAVEHTDVELARTRLYRLLVDLLSVIRESRPLAVVIDDAHWLDPETVNLLDLAVHELVSRGVLFALAVRPDEATDARQAVMSLVTRSGAKARRVPLAGLGADDVARIVRRLSGDEPPPEVVAGVYERTGGNPFFVEELVRLLISERRLDAVGVYSALPDSVRDVIGRRLDRLPEQTRTVLGVLALLGRGADVRLLMRIVGSDADSVLDGCEAAVLVGLLVDDAASGGFALSHDLVRQTLDGGLSPARRTRLHARIAEALRADAVLGVDVAPDRIAELAHHFTAAAPLVGPQAALEYLMVAADDALTRLAASKFSQYLATAQELTDRITDLTEQRRWESVIGGRRSAGRLLGPGGVVDPSAGVIPIAFEPAAAVPLDPEAPAAWWNHVAVLCASGNLAAAAAAIDAALSDDLPPGAGAAVHFMRGTVFMELGRFDEAYASLGRTEELVRLTPGGAARGLFHFGGVATALQAAIATVQGDRAAAARLNDAAEKTPDQTPTQAVSITFQRSWCLIQDGETAKAAAVTARAAELAVRLGPTFYTPWCDLVIAYCDAMQGDRSALARAAAAQGEYRALGMRHQVTTQLTIRAEAHAHHGEVDTARELIREARALAAFVGGSTLGPRLTAIAEQLVPTSQDAGTS